MKEPFTKENITAFLDEINIRLYPITELVYEPKMEDQHRFRIQLRETRFVMRDQVVVETAYRNMIKSESDNFFGQQPEFNNTSNTFWFFE